MKKLHILVALGLCLWLRADTKPDPEPEPTAGARRILVIDGAKTTLYPQTLGLKLMGAQILNTLKDLEAQAESLATLGDSLNASDSRLQAVEGAIE